MNIKKIRTSSTQHAENNPAMVVLRYNHWVLGGLSHTKSPKMFKGV
jgi:hypothetical protein